MRICKEYYSLIKPGVMYGNILTCIAGFLLAAGNARHFDFWLFVATVGGMSLVIGSACALNNYLDRDIDSQMERTKNRATVTGAVPPRNTAIFAISLGVIGFAILAVFTSWLVSIIALVGFIVYVWLYGALSKRRSIHGTLVGAVSGAMPILAGYTQIFSE